MARKSTNPHLAIGYLRVSTEDQNLGPAAQRKAIEAWAAAHGVTLVAVFEDRGVSGATPHEERAGMVAALATMKATGAGLLLAAKRDRLGRDVGVVDALERAVAKLGARVVTADGVGSIVGSAAVLMRGMSDVVASFERAVIRERTTAALQVKRSRGERVGQVPFGYRLAEDGVHLVECTEEQAVLVAIRSLRGEGLSTRAIVAELASRGVTSRSGKPLQKTQVCRILNAA